VNLQAEVSAPTLECAEPQLWQCFDVMSAEVETLEFMAQLVHTVKPRLVVETGSCHGLSAFYIGRALVENKRGRLVTYEVVEELYWETKNFIHRGGLDGVVECRLQSSSEAQIDEPIDLLFADSQEAIRVQEIEHFWPQLSATSLVVVHDVNSGAHKDLRGQILELDKAHTLSVVLLPTPRGLAICQKREGRR
jgi:predicted O-methyltransferase YrrM